MRKKVAFRALIIFLAAAVLLSSTGAYNILVYADQNAVGNSLSAISKEQAAASQPSIAAGGGTLQTNSDDVSISANSESVVWIGNGTAGNPYQISDLAHFLQVNRMVNDAGVPSTTYVDNAAEKHFVLTNDIDISSLNGSDFINQTGSAYFVSADNASSPNIYINLNGSYTDVNGIAQKHKITGGENGWAVNVSGHENFSLFGYLGSNSVLSNVIFENISVNVSSASPREVAIIANKNAGTISGCEVNNCSIIVASTGTHDNPYYEVSGVTYYNGVAGAVADNSGTIDSVSVSNLNVTLTGKDDYIGGVVAQNRGLISASSVSGIRINATNENAYIGGIAGYNIPTSTSLGIKSCSVNMSGGSNYSNNFTKGAFVGGIVGGNEGYLFNSSVTGSFSTASTPSATSYNMLGQITTSNDAITYYGGAVGTNIGGAVIQNCTVSNVGFFMAASTSIKSGYFGGITPTVAVAGAVTDCVAAGTFAAAAAAECYSGGIIAYADNSTPDGALVNSYAMFKISNPKRTYNGAVIGWGGRAAVLNNCRWSDEISGSQSAFFQFGGIKNDIIVGIETFAGKLLAGRRAIVVERGTNANDIPASALTHMWAGESGGSFVTVPNASAALSINTNKPNNTLDKQAYNTTLEMNGSGVGSSDKTSIPLAFNFDVFVTSSEGNPEDVSNPLIINSSTVARYMFLAPYAHYKLGENITVSSSSSWAAPVFTGTLDGNNHTIFANCGIFAEIIGSRGTIGSETLDTQNLTTNPNTDTAGYRNNGLVENLTVDLNGSISTSVFGNAFNATIINVALTDGDPTTDDGNITTDEGYRATLNSERRAAFLNAAYGNSYIYGCSTNVSVIVENDSQGATNNDQAAFISYLSGAVTVDNCYINANVYINGGASQNTGRAAFIGNISNNSSYILNSCISSMVIVADGLSLPTNHCYIIFGNMSSSNVGKYKNIVWASNSHDSIGTAASADVSSGSTLWGGTGAADPYPTSTIAVGGNATHRVTIPQNIDAFGGLNAGDIIVTLENSSKFSCTGVDISGTNIVISVNAFSSATDGDETWVKIYHITSGMTTFVKFTVTSGFTIGADGYFHIKSASDLKFLSDKINSPLAGGDCLPATSTPYRTQAYMLDANIDMSWYDGSDSAHTFAPMGNAAKPFTGIFTAPTNEDGTAKYTISGLTINQEGSNAALFGAVDLAGSITVNGVSVQRHISNFNIDSANVSGFEKVAVLIGTVSNYQFVDTNGNSSAYGAVTVSNISITNSTITAGDSTDPTATGRYASAVIAFAENSAMNISGIRLNNVDIRTYYQNASSEEFVTNNATGSSGIGGVLGESTDNTVLTDNSVDDIFTDIVINDLSIVGLNSADNTEIYATVNAGGIIGSHQRTYYSDTATANHSISIGSSTYSGADHDIVVSDSVIMVTKIAGGIIGVTNAVTTIRSAVVRGTQGEKTTDKMNSGELLLAPMRILSKTDHYIGGIAGYIAPYKNDNLSISSSYGLITGCEVVNTVVMATDPKISTAPSTYTDIVERNVAVGGIVGAIQGNTATFKAVENCSLSYSHIEGIAVGGIAGTSIEIERSIGSAELKNHVIHIGNCNVVSSMITTPAACYSMLDTADFRGANGLVFGVGGILGTNRRGQLSFSGNTTIEYCNVDSDTRIENYCVFTYEYIDSVGATIPANCRVSTGGILGSGFESVTHGEQLLLQYNEVYASILAPAEGKADDESYAMPGYSARGKVHIGTGGIVGMLCGFTLDTNTGAPNAEAGCFLDNISILHSVYGGSISATDCIGGVVGTITVAYATPGVTLPNNIIKDIAITGTLSSTSGGANIVHGGIAVGHTPFRIYGSSPTISNRAYTLWVATSTTDISNAFGDIYYSSYNIDTSIFPFFGYMYSSPTNTNKYYPLNTDARTLFKTAYTDVNAQADETTAQYSAETSLTGSKTESAPIINQGNYSIAGGTQWTSNKSSIVSVTTEPSYAPTVNPLHSGDAQITIDYTHTMTDGGSWNRLIALKAGFSVHSNNEQPLQKVTVSGVDYYIIRNTFDLTTMGINTADGNNYNYWLANDIDIDDGYYDEFERFTPFGTAAHPFSGTFRTIPQGSYPEVGINKTDDAPFTIRNLKMKAVADGVSSMFGVVSGTAYNETSGSQFSKFILDGVDCSGDSNTAYIGSVASKITGPVSADNITIRNASLSGADYVGGIFGGIFYGTDTADSSITSCTVSDSTITARLGAAGIVVHTSQYYTNISGITVSDSTITQAADTLSATFDNGAAGICLAYSGTLAANGAARNKIQNCTISGEIASGAIGRTYTSNSATDFGNAGVGASVYALTSAGDRATVSISAVDLEGTRVIGNYTKSTSTGASNFWASAGVLARVDSAKVLHAISDCNLDAQTEVTALYAAGGIVGCFEQLATPALNNVAGNCCGVQIDSCTTKAAISITTTIKVNSNANSYASYGCGGIVGYFGTVTPLIHSSISNCTVGGTITGVSVCGGIIGAIWCSVTSGTPLAMYQLQNVDANENNGGHFVSDCVVSADLMISETERAFGSENCSATGVVVGNVYNAILSAAYLYKTLSTEFDGTNNPFYNIYFSEYNYPSGSAYLFGRPKNVTLYSLNYRDDNSDGVSDFSCYTDYCYDINDKSYTIDAASHTITASSANRRINLHGEAGGIVNLDYISVSNGASYAFDILDTGADNYLTFDATATGLNYYIDASPVPSIGAFTAVGAGASASDSRELGFELESVTSSSPAIDVVHTSGTSYSLSCNTALIDTLNTEIVFNYTNGLKLYIDLKINLSSDEYWFLDNAGVRTYLVFNAKNLSVIGGGANVTNAVVKQCFDVFWTLDDSAMAAAVNSFVAGKTLGDVYDSTFIDELVNYSCPNPDYNPQTDPVTDQFITFGNRYGVSAQNPAADVLLSELVGEISPVSYGAFGEDKIPAIYNNSTPFAGTYESLGVVNGLRDTVLATAGSHYAIYGLDLRCQNTSAQGNDAEYAGMFAQLGAATISNITFVNPKIDVISSHGTANYVGILAGKISGATVNNIRIIGSNGNDADEFSNDSYVKNIRWMTSAQAATGAVCGELSSGTISGFDISNIDVVTSNIARNNSSLNYLYTGGVAGISSGAIIGSTADGGVGGSITDCNIYTERLNESFKFYLAYAGGIAAKATGTIGGSGAGEGITLTNINIMGCDTSVDASSSTSDYTVDRTALVADRLGGIVGLSSGTLSIIGCNISGMDIVAFDIAGGVVAEIEDNASSKLTVSGCNIGLSDSEQTKASVRVLGTNNIITGSTRIAYDAAGGVVGKLGTTMPVNQGNMTPIIDINDCEFIGNVGTYSFDNAEKDCTAGGVIGIITSTIDNSVGYLDRIRINDCTVEGSVEGFRRDRGASPSDAVKEFSGAAGGIIGKIFNYGTKSSVSTYNLISNCIMSASVDLYTGVTGSKQNANPTNPKLVDTYAGKIIGELRNAVSNSNFAATAGTQADSRVELTKYVNNVYISSYPQDTVVYGCKDFYNNANCDEHDTYIDINKENRYLTDESTELSSVNTFMIDSTTADPNNAPADSAYNSGLYSDTAVITFDQNAAASSASRYFRLAFDNLTVGSKTIDYNIGNPVEVKTDDDATADVAVNFYRDAAVLSESVTVDGTTHSYDYYPGVITVSNVQGDVVGNIALSYSHGLQVGITFISMEISGKGTQAQPFLVENSRHFKVVRALRGAFYKQIADIDITADIVDSDTPEYVKNQYANDEDALFNDGTGFEPIGSEAFPFTGSYDGDGYIVKNVYINENGADGIGFFGYTGNGNTQAKLSNIHIEIAGELNDVTIPGGTMETVSGGIIGGENVGGLVGCVTNADIKNCSVAGGFVMGDTAVGGLVGYSRNCAYVSCFTSTSTYSYNITDNETGASKNIGALIGTVASSNNVSNCFTLGLASVGTTKTFGAAGGLVGYVDSAVALNLSYCFVGATVSDYSGVIIGSGDNATTYCGLTVGAASDSASVIADNITIAATRAIASNYRTIGNQVVSKKMVNPILAGIAGATINSSVKYDAELVGVLNGSESAVAQASSQSSLLTDGKYSITIGNGGNAATDAYTHAYVDFASVPVQVGSKEASDRENANAELNGKYTNGLFYPVTMANDGSVSFVSSVFDSTDKDEIQYPALLDSDMYGDSDDKTLKKTDLLFRDNKSGSNTVSTTIYSNTYSTEAAEALADTGYVGFNCKLPSFKAHTPESITRTNTNGVQTTATININRTVVYPIEQRSTGGYRTYQISTARQFAALGNANENVAGSKFAFIYNEKATNFTLAADIDLGNGYSFTPIVGYNGVLNGNGFTVKNLKIDMRGSNEVGMFRTLSQGTIENLCISVVSVNGQNNVGALAGAIITSKTGSSDASSVRIYNCSSKMADGNDNEGVVGSGANVGGLIGAAMRCGDNTSRDEKSKLGIYNSNSSVTVTGVNNVGGLVGYCEQPVDNSYATGEVNASFTNVATAYKVTPRVVTGIVRDVSCSTAVHGVGGLVGVIYRYSGSFGIAGISACFGSGTVTVDSVAYAAGIQHGVGGLVGVDCAGAAISTSFSSGNVSYCDGKDVPKTNCGTAPIGVGGFAGITNEAVHDVYSCAAVAAAFGTVDSATTYEAGIGGVVGIAYANLSNAYSSGSTLGTTTTLAVESTYKYGVGGVLGILASNTQCAVLYYDLNKSVTRDVVGKLLGTSSVNTGNVKSMTTAQMTDADNTYMSSDFGYADGAYPYINSFFGSGVTMTIRLNAILSIVAIQTNELDTSAANGDGVSMALSIPTDLRYGTSDPKTVYTYGYEAVNESADDAIANTPDMATNTLTFQRTQNNSQFVNCKITIASIDGTTTDEDGVLYSNIADTTRRIVCAPMLGTAECPYLISTQTDLGYVGMKADMLDDDIPQFYKQWVTPINENGVGIAGRVHFRLMGYVDLNSFNRAVPNLVGQAYPVGEIVGGTNSIITYSGLSLDGNGYSIRNLSSPLFDTLDASSELKNITFENVSFENQGAGVGGCLVKSLAGTVEGVNVFGSSSGQNTASIAYDVVPGGHIKGCLSNVSYYEAGAPGKVAGIAVENNGTIELSASVGDFEFGSVAGFGSMVVTNNGTISNCFTMGNITATNADNFGGFVNNNTGEITNCYTRCNINVTNTATTTVGSFAAQNTGTISGCYSSGMLDLNNSSLPALSNVFVGNQSTGTLTDCMYDKQMSGTDYANIYKNAERTIDIVNLTNHPSLINATDGYTVSAPTVDSSTSTYTNIYYPQLSKIINTYSADEGGAETVSSRMYRVLRAYSFISSATVMVGNDNYIDNLPINTQTALSFDSSAAHAGLWSISANAAGASLGNYGGLGANKGRYLSSASTTGTVTLSAASTAANPVIDFHGYTLTPARIDIFANVTTDGHPNFAGGSGTEGSPFQISSPEQVVALSFYGTNAENHFIVNNDINMNEAVWSSYIDNFRGHLNGNGKALSNITIPVDGNSSVFGNILSGAEISSLGITGASVISSGSSAGLLASTATGATITGCYTTGTVTDSAANAVVGGLVGAASGNTAINDSYSIGKVNATATGAVVGGLVGLANNANITGCIASGKVNSAGTAGGIVGNAAGGSALTNCLSTAFVSATTTAGGVLGSGDNTVAVTNAVFANTANAAAAGNIVGGGEATVANAFYDEQFSTVSGGEACSTYYLTKGAVIDSNNHPFGDGMVRIDGFTGYPVPASMVSGTRSTDFMTGVELASAQITLASGVGAGTITSFDKITAPDDINGKIAAFSTTEPEGENYLLASGSTITTNTAGMSLGQRASGVVSYGLTDAPQFDEETANRYFDVTIGKTIKVTYKFESAANSSIDAVLTVSNSGAASSVISAVSAFVKNYETSSSNVETLCNDMVFAPNEDGDYVANINCELPKGIAVSDVSAKIISGVNQVGSGTVGNVSNGKCTLTLSSSLSSVVFDEIEITVTVANEQNTAWGIRTINSLV